VDTVTSPERPTSVRPVDYKGEPLDAERGPGLGCFRFQVALLAIFVILTPLTVIWNWPVEISIALLFATIILLLFTGQTIIFLLRLVAADRREGRRVPLASGTKTVGQLADAEAADVPPGAIDADAVAGDAAPDPADDENATPPPDPGVRE
jgi:hypothetical protein